MERLWCRHFLSHGIELDTGYHRNGGGIADEDEDKDEGIVMTVITAINATVPSVFRSVNPFW